VRPCIATLRPEIMPSSGSAGTFDNLLSGRLIRTSEMPLLTAGCVLLGEGVYPNTVLSKWLPRSPDPALRRPFAAWPVEAPT
jgi:hypothetical protein